MLDFARGHANKFFCSTMQRKIEFKSILSPYVWMVIRNLFRVLWFEAYLYQGESIPNDELHHRWCRSSFEKLHILLSLISLDCASKWGCVVRAATTLSERGQVATCSLGIRAVNSNTKLFIGSRRPHNLVLLRCLWTISPALFCIDFVVIHL